jgi:DNA replication protein DnaC
VIALEKARSCLEALGLLQASEILDSRLQKAASDGSTYAEFLSDILGEEIAKRRQRNVEARSKLAHFPFKRTLGEFDFDFQPSVDKKLIMELATLSFLSEAVNVVFLGPPGVGKSHLSVALGMEAVNHGISVYFTKAHDMLTDLKKAYQEGRIRRRVAMYLRPKLLICDEVGFLPLDRLEADLFFQVVSARYERSSTVVTSNKSFGDWGELVGDPVLASAILDRLLHHSHIINIRGESYRLKEKARAGIYSGPKV